METALASLRHALRQLANPERAPQEKRYLKSDDVFLGVSVPAGHRIAREFKSTHRALPFATVRAIADALWQSDIHEEKRLAAQVLNVYAASLTPEDWPLLTRWTRTAGSWDLIDEIAPHLLGVVAEKWPQLEEEFDAWITDDNLWVRRAALVSHVMRIRHATVAPERVRSLCDSLMMDREYFVVKALGWVLRECAVREPDETIAFLQRHAQQTSRMVLREAVSKLDKERQQMLLGEKKRGL